MKTNPETQEIIVEIEKNIEKTKSRFWIRILKEIKKKKQAKREINISRINKHTKKNDVIIAPGKVLGDVELQHPITITYFNISKSAESKIKKAKIVYLKELLKKNNKGKGVKIIG